MIHWKFYLITNPLSTKLINLSKIVGVFTNDDYRIYLMLIEIYFNEYFKGSILVLM